MLIETPMLVVGSGAGALVAAKAAGWLGLPTLLVGHDLTCEESEVSLSADAVAGLQAHQLLNVLQPVLTAAGRVSPRQFEAMLKAHCVADINVTVYDHLELLGPRPVGRGLMGTLAGGGSQWELAAEFFIDSSKFPPELSAQISRGLTAVEAARRFFGPALPHEQM